MTCFQAVFILLCGAQMNVIYEFRFYLQNLILDIINQVIAVKGFETPQKNSAQYQPLYNFVMMLH